MERVLKSEDLRAFVDRRWDLIEREKRDFLADRFRRGGPAAAHAAARRLFRRWRALHPEAICPKRRADDLAAHVALKRQLERAGDDIRGY